MVVPVRVEVEWDLAHEDSGNGRKPPGGDVLGRVRDLGVRSNLAGGMVPTALGGPAGFCGVEHHAQGVAADRSGSGGLGTSMERKSGDGQVRQHVGGGGRRVGNVQGEVVHAPATVPGVRGGGPLGVSEGGARQGGGQRGGRRPV